MSHTFRLRLACAAIFLFAVSFGNQALAQTTNVLVKGSGPAVYYKAADEKRYVFPNEAIFKSWYANATTTIAHIADADLASIPLGGNVTFRPGSTLVKITTDPRVYAVSRYGVLHWITSETAASALYGTDWNKKVMDIPDTLFINYTVGDPIASASAFSVTRELDGSVIPQADLRSSSPALAVVGIPAVNTVELSYFAPFGSATATAALVDGTDIGDKALAICDGDCSITLQVNTSGSVTAFSRINGTDERSNTVTVSPE